MGGCVCLVGMACGVRLSCVVACDGLVRFGAFLKVSVSVLSWVVWVCGTSFCPGPAVVLVTGHRPHGLPSLSERSEIVLGRMCGWKWKLMGLVRVGPG